MRAKATRRCLAASGFACNVDTGTNVIVGRLQGDFGEAECAATQTVHVAASLPSEWWCDTRAHADESVSTMQSADITFTSDRINQAPQNVCIKSTRSHPS